VDSVSFLGKSIEHLKNGRWLQQAALLPQRSFKLTGEGID
jgi:hypothetical protein